MTRLVASGVGVERGGRQVFSELSLAVGAGELLAITGPNGAGKSTLLRLLAGLLTPTSGSIRLEPESDRPIGWATAYLGHLDALKGAETVGENLAFWRDISERPGDSVVDALEVVGLAHLDDTPAFFLSAGQRRRVAIARLLVDRRTIWLLDEPTNALDSASEAMMGRLIARQLGEGGIVVAASHTPLPVKPTASLRMEASQ